MAYYLMDVVLIKPIEQAAPPPPGDAIYSDGIAPGWTVRQYGLNDVEVPASPSTALARQVEVIIRVRKTLASHTNSNSSNGDGV